MNKSLHARDTPFSSDGWLTYLASGTCSSWDSFQLHLQLSSSIIRYAASPRWMSELAGLHQQKLPRGKEGKPIVRSGTQSLGVGSVTFTWCAGWWYLADCRLQVSQQKTSEMHACTFLCPEERALRINGAIHILALTGAYSLLSPSPSGHPGCHPVMVEWRVLCLQEYIIVIIIIRRAAQLQTCTSQSFPIPNDAKLLPSFLPEACCAVSAPHLWSACQSFRMAKHEKGRPASQLATSLYPLSSISRNAL